MREYVDRARESHFFDGPNGDDYAYLNSTIHKREGMLYTDLAKWENGYEWHRAGPPFGLPLLPPRRTIELAGAFASLGAFSFEGLEAIGEIWHGITLSDDTHWQEISALNLATINALPGAPSQAEFNLVADWQFPLYGIDIRERKISLKDRSRTVGS